MTLTTEEHDVICRRFINNESIPIDGMVSLFDKRTAIITYVLIYMDLFTCGATINCKTVPFRDVVATIRTCCFEMGYEFIEDDFFVTIKGIGNIHIVKQNDSLIVASPDCSITVTI